MIPIKTAEQLINEDWRSDQRFEQRYARDRGIDLSHLDSKKWSAAQMGQQRFALERKVSLSPIDQSLDWAEHHPRRVDGRFFANLDPDQWNDKQMREQFWALAKGFDLSSLEPKNWGWAQMQQLRKGMQRGETSPPEVVCTKRSGR